MKTLKENIMQFEIAQKNLAGSYCCNDFLMLCIIVGYKHKLNALKVLAILGSPQFYDEAMQDDNKILEDCLNPDFEFNSSKTTELVYYILRMYERNNANAELDYKTYVPTLKDMEQIYYISNTILSSHLTIYLFKYLNIELECYGSSPIYEMEIIMELNNLTTNMNVDSISEILNEKLYNEITHNFEYIKIMGYLI